MFYLLLLTISITTRIIISLRMETCVPEANIAVYEELKCTPVTNDTNTCISSYDCNFLFKTDRTMCYYQGIEFSVGDKLIGIKNGTCYPICTCENITEEAQFLCSKIQCEEIYSGNDSCLYTYSKNECCAVMEYCGAEKEIAKKDLSICEYRNITLYEGQYIEDDCRRCICDVDFDSENFDIQSCERIQCEIERTNAQDIQNLCAPVFFRSYECCPLFWYCSSGNENITTNHTLQTFTNEKCMFGDWLLETNQKLTIDGHQPYTYCIKCECIVPPFLTCTINKNCEYNSLYGVIEDRSRRSYRRKIERKHNSGDYYNYH